MTEGPLRYAQDDGSEITSNETDTINSMKPKKALFITCDGPEGSGKSTQSLMLVRALEKEGHSVVHAIEPGGTELGDKIRQLLLHHSASKSPHAETLLFMASRAQLVEEVIRPALKERKIVVCDRWLDATIAYQGYGLGVNTKWIQNIAHGFLGKLKPNLSFYFDVKTEEGLKRASSRSKPDEIEKRNIGFHKRVRQGYLAITKSEKRFVVIPPADIQTTHQKVMETAHRVLA